MRRYKIEIKSKHIEIETIVYKEDMTKALDPFRDDISEATSLHVVSQPISYDKNIEPEVTNES